MCRVGVAARRPRLRDRRDRGQGRLLRPATQPRVAARASALRPRVQVGSDIGGHAPDGDTCPGGSHRCAQSTGRARAGSCRRRDRLERDAAQRGRHPSQGHPGRRPRDRPARWRRDSAGGRPRRRARAGNEAVADAEALPALQGRGRAARERGDAPLSQPGVPVARARDAVSLGRAPLSTSKTSAAARSRSSGTRGSSARSLICTG